MNRYMLTVRTRRVVTTLVEEVYYVNAGSLLEAAADLEGALEDGVCTPVDEVVLEEFSTAHDPQTVRVELIGELQDEVDVDPDDFGGEDPYDCEDEDSDISNYLDSLDTSEDTHQEAPTFMGLPAAVYSAPGDSYAPIMVTVVSPDERTTDYLNGAPVAVAEPVNGYNFIQTFEHPDRS